MKFEPGWSKAFNQYFGPSQEYPTGPNQGCREKEEDTGLQTFYFKKALGTFSLPWSFTLLLLNRNDV